jgi:hypothetical protein
MAKKEKKGKKGKKDAFIWWVFIINNPNASNLFDADGGLGYHLGVATGGSLYWQVGARYNRVVYNLMRPRLPTPVTHRMRSTVFN